MPGSNDSGNSWTQWSEYILKTIESMVYDIKTMWDKSIRQEIQLEQSQILQNEILNRLKAIKEKHEIENKALNQKIDSLNFDNSLKIKELSAKLEVHLSKAKMDKIEENYQKIEKDLKEKLSDATKKGAPYAGLLIVWQILQEGLSWIGNNWEKISSLFNSG